MKITDTVQRAIRKGVERAGSQAEFARISGIHVSLVGKYLNGKIRSVDDENEIKLRSAIKGDIEVQPPGLSPDEEHLLKLFRVAGSAGRRAAAELLEKSIVLDVLKSARTG